MNRQFIFNQRAPSVEIPYISCYMKKCQRTESAFKLVYPIDKHNLGITIAFHVDFGYSLFCRSTPKQHEERALGTHLRRPEDVIIMFERPAAVPVTETITFKTKGNK